MGTTAQQVMQRKLLESFQEARIRNPQYSLRSYARKLGLSPAATSEILRGKRNVSLEKAQVLLDRIGLEPEERRRVLAEFVSVPGLTTLDATPEAVASAAAARDFRELTADQFQATAEWFHFAILSLVETKGFRSSSDWIARRLGIKEREAKDAVERLVRLGLLKKTGNRLVPTGVQFTTPDEVRNLALRRAQSENLDLARHSLENDDITERDFLSLTLAMTPEKLALAKKRVREFLASLCDELEEGEKTEVYKINVQAFALSKPEGRSGK